MYILYIYTSIMVYIARCMCSRGGYKQSTYNESMRFSHFLLFLRFYILKRLLCNINMYLQESISLYHIDGLKCCHCGGYNTVQSGTTYLQLISREYHSWTDVKVPCSENSLTYRNTTVILIV